MKKIILSVAIIATCLSACKKKSDDPAPTNPSSTNGTTNKTPSEKETLLTQNTWHFTAATADKPIVYFGSDNASTDVYSQMDTCVSDVDFIFNSNKAGTYSGDCGGAITLNTLSFKWALNSNETILSFNLYGPLSEWTILQLDETTLKVTYQDKDINGLSYIVTETYKKK